VGAPIRREAPAIFFVFGRAPPVFGSKSTISRFGERFRDDQYSLVSFLFAVLLLTVPPCPASCNSGGHVPPVPHCSHIAIANYCSDVNYYISVYRY